MKIILDDGTEIENQGQPNDYMIIVKMMDGLEYHIDRGKHLDEYSKGMVKVFNSEGVQSL